MISPTIYTAEKVGINLADISDNAVNVIRQLQEAGYNAYLVGGSVRDLILNLKPKDFDVATDATPEQVKGVIQKSRIVGRRFKIVHARFGYEVVEVTTFRANANDRENTESHEMRESEEGQLIRDNVFGTIEEDVMRRDFRCNALYYDPIGNEVLDFLGSLDDIQEKRLISIGEPEQRFREDPVRMLRVIRFSAKLGFSVEPEATQMIEQEGKLLSNVSAARLFDEVLKLFHGGSAYDTFKLLRKNDLFKYLFPFTDQCLVEGVEGMPERALQNTDKRIHEGKPVIPAFLFACMMWDPVKQDAQTLMNNGSPGQQAWRIAMNDGLRDQNQYVAVPRRLAEIIMDIWNIHFRLIKRNPRMVKACLNNRRFRAAYDFLLLRSALHEVDEEIADWWTRVQEVDAAEREEMIIELGEVYKMQRQTRHASGERNGNSIAYNSDSYGNSDGQEQSYQRRSRYPGQRHKKPGCGGQGRPKKDGFRANNNGGGGGGYRQKSYSNGYGGFNKQQPSYDAAVKDDYGTHTANETTKKVKVRRKRKIVGKASSDGGQHF